MPLYEYHCEHCNRDFERRVNMDERKRPQACPHCERASARIEMSVFAMAGGGSAELSDCAGGYCDGDFAGSGGHGCGPGCACAGN